MEDDHGSTPSEDIEGGHVPLEQSSGSVTKQLEVIMEKCYECVGFITNKCLPHQSVWTGFWVQLGVAVKYGIDMYVFTQAEMECLIRPYIYLYKFLPSMGCNCN